METVEKRVFSILRDQLGIPEEQITPDLFIMGQIDSPDHVELIMILEEEFDITIPVEEALRIETVAQAIRYIKERADRSELCRPKGTSPTPESGPLWDRELDG
jgi:acyl carrier protein